MKILEIPYMGAFCNCKAGIFLKGDKIYCESLNKIYECDMTQFGWGNAICPLHGFVIDLSQKSQILEWYDCLNNYWKLKEIAKILEKFLKNLRCDICKRTIEGAYNLLHYSKDHVVCDTCFNEEPQKSNEILFKK